MKNPEGAVVNNLQMFVICIWKRVLIFYSKPFKNTNFSGAEIVGTMENAKNEFENEPLKNLDLF